MKLLMVLLTVSLTFLAGCRKESPIPDDPARVVVSEGDTFEAVVKKLGTPSIDSASGDSRVLIYDEIEIKLKNDVVVEVFDHRSE